MLAERTKTCANPACGRTLPIGEFYARTDAWDGLQSQCKKCSRERRAQWAEDNRERLRELHRTTHARRRADPERAAIERVRKREWARAKRGTQPESYRTSRFMRATVSADLLPAAPFAARLLEIMERDGSSQVECAAVLGISARTVGAIVRGERLDVETETVERALFADDTMDLRDLYPDLYSEAA